MDRFSTPLIATRSLLGLAPRLTAYLLAAPALLLIAACTTFQEVEEDKITLLWPNPPDPPKFAYETTLRTALDVSSRSALDIKKKIDLGKTLLGKLETAGTEKKVATTNKEKSKIGIVKPFDVAAWKGKIIVSDTALRVVFLFDVPGRSLSVFGRRGEGKLEKPLGVAIDNETNYYVADVGARNVKVFDTNGHFIRKIGSSDDLIRPTDVAVSPDGERIYVVDAGGVTSKSHQVVMYDKDGQKIGIIGGRGDTEGKFNLPTHAVVGADGTLYVLDTGNFRVQVFDRDGKFQRTWGSAGSAYGSFARPRGIGVDLDGNVYVTDATFLNFQVFNKEGQLLLFIGEERSAKIRNRDKPGHYLLPAGIAVDETNRAYVVDQYLQKVEVIRRLSDEESKKLVEER